MDSRSPLRTVTTTFGRLVIVSDDGDGGGLDGVSGSNSRSVSV